MLIGDKIACMMIIDQKIIEIKIGASTYYVELILSTDLIQKNAIKSIMYHIMYDRAELVDDNGSMVLRPFFRKFSTFSS